MTSRAHSLEIERHGSAEPLSRNLQDLGGVSHGIDS
jgi:hypothetical protein